MPTSAPAAPAVPAPSQASPEPSPPVARHSHDFEAEVSQVLHLVIHSLYSHKEVFLRELISNASDALDKLRFRALTEPDLMGGDGALEIRVTVDREKGTLTIADTGVGMTEEELTRELGTVARSGSKAFLEQLAEKKKDVSLIGQFGVGFYSAYLVADRVDVLSRAAGQESAFLWSSDGQKSFTVEPATRAERGTSVTLHLKAEQKEFLETWRLRELIARYSDYVAHPIRMVKEGKEAGAGELETVNRASALWQRPKAEITDEQYDEFYQHLTHDHEKPLAHVHFKLEGSQELTALLFIPRVPPFELGVSREARGVRLFVKRVLIMDRCEELVPEWLRFVRGVVDSEDLPLNVSREVLQDSQASRAIKKQLVKATLDLLDRIAEDKPDDYLTFWKSFGVMVKEGLAVDFEVRERLGKLRPVPELPHAGGRCEGRRADLAPRLRRANAGRAGGDLLRAGRVTERGRALAAPRGAPAARLRGPLHDRPRGRVGGRVAPHVRGEAARVGDARRAEARRDRRREEGEGGEGEGAGPLLARMKEALGERVVDVRVSDRLTDSPACLVLQGAGPHGYVDRLLRERGRDVPKAKRVMEINAAHPVIEYLRAAVANGAGGGATAEKVNDWIAVLYDQALLTEGSALEDPNRFARLVTSLLTEAAAAAAK